MASFILHMASASRLFPIVVTLIWQFSSFSVSHFGFDSHYGLVAKNTDLGFYKYMNSQSPVAVP